MESVIISYIKEDRRKMANLSFELKMAGLKVHEFPLDIATNPRHLASKLKKCDLFLSLYTQESLSTVTDLNGHLADALSRQAFFPRQQKFVIPVSLDGTMPGKGDLSSFTILDLSEDWHNQIEKFIEGLGITESQLLSKRSLENTRWYANYYVNQWNTQNQIYDFDEAGKMSYSNNYRETQLLTERIRHSKPRLNDNQPFEVNGSWLIRGNQLYLKEGYHCHFEGTIYRRRIIGMYRSYVNDWEQRIALEWGPGVRFADFLSEKVKTWPLYFTGINKG